MERNNFYRTRIEEFTQQYTILKKLESQLSVWRLVIFLVSFLLFYFIFSVSIPLAVTILAIGLLSLGWIIRFQNGIIRKKEYFYHLTVINQQELDSLDGNYYYFNDGTEYENKNHPYAYDLDIFGHASLFQFINRTISSPASDMLAEWLRTPASKAEIPLRQQAVLELKDLADWRQKLMALGYEYKDAARFHGTVINWSNSADSFLNKRWLKVTTYLLTLLSLAAFALVINGMPMIILLLAIGINMAINYQHLNTINKLHLQVSKSYEMLQSYSAAIKLIEDQAFKSEKMQSIHAQLLSSGSASGLIQELSKLIGKFDLRLNLLLAFPLNVFFFWDIHMCFALEKWKNRHARHMKKWFSAMAEVEVLSSMANMSFNNPEWTMPSINPQYFHLDASDIGHPLIPVKRRVTNSFHVDGAGKIVLVTGSNMSGKSTFQRTLGVNMVLAFAGAPVCASSFEVSLVKILTSMRISDSLEDNTSSFYAELKRLAMIIQESENNRNVFLLLDEILRGTNSNDRHIGSVALIRQLIQQNTTAMVATHDLSLSELSQELPQNIDNYNFDVKIHGEELFFDYKLNRGICKSLNASILMKKMGIKV